MSIKQKLIIDESKSNQFQIIVRDETGLYTPSNTTGYGGQNGSPASQFSRYIFDIYNLNTNQSYRQIQSDNIDNPDEFYNPSIERIVNKEDVILDCDNFDLNSFTDGVYKINMNVEIDVTYFGEGYKNTDTIVNVQGAKALFENYQGIIVGNNIYYITCVEDSTLILDRYIKEGEFSSFRPILKTSETFILYDKLNDCLNKKIAEIASKCVCDSTVNLNNISELQLLDWGVKIAIKKQDYLQAKEYLDLMFRLCSSLKCRC